MHAVALVPIKARMTSSRQPFSPALTVNLTPRDAPPALPRVPLPTASPDAPATAQATATTPAPASDPPATPGQRADTPKADPPPQPTGTSASPSAVTTRNAATQSQAGLRLAVQDEVSVRVQLLSFEGGQKPIETVLVQGTSYVYFKSSSLRRSTQPLGDINPRYPVEKPHYLHGAVILQLLIDEEGKLEQANVVCSNPDFEKSALASVEHLRFSPALAVTGPVKSYMVVEFGYGRGYPCAPVPDLSPSR